MTEQSPSQNLPDSKEKAQNSVEMEAEYICQCFQVQESTIKAHIREGKLKSIEEITEVCGAGGGCQSCHMLLELFLDQFNSPQPVEDNKTEKPNQSKKGFLGRLFSKS